MTRPGNSLARFLVVPEGAAERATDVLTITKKRADRRRVLWRARNEWLPNR